MLSYLTTLSIRARLSIGFGIILLLMITLTVLGIQKVNIIDETLSKITDVNSVKQRHAINYRGSVHDRAISIRDVVSSRTRAEMLEFEDEIKKLELFYQDSENAMKKMMSSGVSFSEKEKELLSDIDEIQKRTLPLVKKIIQYKNQSQNVNINDIMLDEVRPAFTQWLKAINKFIDYQEKENQEATPEARNVASGFQELMLVLSTIALLISILVAALIENSLRRSLGSEPNEAADALFRISKGDLTRTLKTEYSDSMIGSLNTMQQTLSKTVFNIVEASKQLAEQTHTVSTSSEQAYQAAKSQALLTTDTATRLDAMRDNIDQVSQTASRTEENSSATASFAKQGRDTIIASSKEMDLISETVGKTVEQIRRLEERTKEISGIASVISNISDQTNLLALNAAIEAARAGESGRGFAVVADEVRQLAKRTGEATAEIDQMIAQVQAETAASVAAMETTQPQVENGRALTIETTELLQNIEQQASDSLTRIREVARAANEQVSSITSIAESMDKIAAMSNDSISSLQDNNTAISSLNQLSRQLKSDVAYFKIDASS